MFLVDLAVKACFEIAICRRRRSEGFKTIAWALGLLLAMVWIGQGLLATQIDIGLAAQANDLVDSKKMLVVVSISLENRGVRQTNLHDGWLTVCGGACSDRSKERIPRQLKEIGYGPYWTPVEFGGVAGWPYTLVWGTKESRQIAFEMEPAGFYDVRFSVSTTEPGGAIAKWRASRIVPIGKVHAKVDEDSERFTREGKSPEIEAPGGESKSVLDLFKKLLGGEK
jgi:hypothetical protein